MKTRNKDIASQMPEIKTYFHKENLDQKKLFKIKLKTLELSSNHKAISHTNIHNKKRNNENEKTKSNYLNFSEIYKLKSNKAKTLYSYNDKRYNYNNPELNNDLKRFTNNSVNFRMFNELNKPYHPYSVNKIQKYLLLDNKYSHKGKKQKNLMNINFKINRINSSRYKNIDNTQNNTDRKERKKIFYGISPIHLPIYLDPNRIKDLELLDEVDINYFDNYKMHKIIRNTLINDDINHDVLNNNLYSNYLKSIIHQINYFEDINIIPHIENKLSMIKPYKDINHLCNKLLNRNYLHKNIAISINRSFIINELLKNKKELEEKKMMEKNEYKPKKDWGNNIYYNKTKLNQYEKKFDHFELTDFFNKCYNYGYTRFADKKYKDLIFSKKFLKIYEDL